jgi:hypothetical protein
MKWMTIPFLRYILLPLLKFTTLWHGEQAWIGWEGLTRFLTKASGLAARWFRNPDEPAFVGMMRMIDLADGLIGVRGAWQTTGDLSATKTIPNCLLAEHLQSTPGFCTRLGVIMGQEVFKRYAPEYEIEYEIEYDITTTLSQGHAECHYILRLKPHKV